MSTLYFYFLFHLSFYALCVVIVVKHFGLTVFKCAIQIKLTLLDKVNGKDCHPQHQETPENVQDLLNL